MKLLMIYFNYCFWSVNILLKIKGSFSVYMNLEQDYNAQGFCLQNKSSCSIEKSLYNLLILPFEVAYFILAHRHLVLGYFCFNNKITL